MLAGDIWYPKKCNCIIWAYVMRFLTGGGLILKLSTKKWKDGFHCAWQSPGGIIYSYEPKDDKEVSWWTGLTEILFEGKVVIHTKEEIEERQLRL